MRIRNLFLLFVLTLIGAFTALNWGVFLANSPVSLGVATVQAPLGLVMLGLLFFVVAYFLVYVLYLQSTVLFDARRHAQPFKPHGIVKLVKPHGGQQLRQGSPQGLRAVANAAVVHQCQCMRKQQAKRCVRAVVDGSGQMAGNLSSLGGQENTALPKRCTGAHGSFKKGLSMPHG